MATLEPNMQLVGLSSPPDQQGHDTNDRCRLDETQASDDAAAQRAALRAHKAQIAALRAAKASRDAARHSIKPRKAWIGYGAGVGVFALLCSVVGVTMARENLKTNTLQREQQSSATLICIDGVGKAANSKNAWTWLTGGHSFQCKNWETLDAKRDRERAAEQARILAREKMARQSAGY